VRRVAIIASASGSGKTTLARELARRLRVEHVELDAIVHGPGWTELSDAELRRTVEPIVQREAWVIDGVYTHKLGNLVVDAADTIVWLDLPMRVWLPRLYQRTRRRIKGDEVIFNDNRESWRTALVGWDSLFVYALRQYPRRRRTWARTYAGYPLTRLRSQVEVDRWLNEAHA
jgi:adenylate kinase family enzyme